VEARYVADAYHSLSIEGYRVTATLIEKIRDGGWNPDGDDKDRATRDAMAARGYFQTHALVKEDLVRVVKGENPGAVFQRALPRWYQALFSPSVQAGILKASDLAGYRNDQVFIRGALHVPLSKEAVRECMPVLSELLEAEAQPQVRAVLGHFLFVYVHPCMDGNGCLARFLMNLMLVPAGYVWTVIPVERRKEYMNARAGEFLCKHRAFCGFHRRACPGAGRRTSSTTALISSGPARQGLQQLAQTQHRQASRFDRNIRSYADDAWA